MDEVLHNYITSLSNSNGELINDQNGMCNIAKDYFDQLFKQGLHDE
jgi:hypothetical protein